MIDAHNPFNAEIDRRLGVLTSLVLIGFLTLMARLFQLQVVRGPEMARLAERNKTQVIPLLAPRGFILDRNGEALVDNVPRFSLFIDAQVTDATKAEIEARLTELFPESADILRRRLDEARSTGKMTRLISDIPREKALGLLERKIILPGINVIVEPKRRGRFGSLACHLLGYVDEISQEELERRKNAGQNFRFGQFVGKIGVERYYDSYLRGLDGGLQFEVDASGRHVHVLRQIPSRSGADLTLTIDRRIQEAVEKGLAASTTGKGAAVVLDPRSGAVLALASAPGFDPSGNLAAYIGDPAHPFFNRALQGTYPPGSVFKVMTAASGLQYTQWNVNRVFYCPGFFELGPTRFGCWKKHYSQNFMAAVAWSCNVYFFNIGLAVDRAVGPEALERMARNFGFGEKTGIDMPSESSGFIPGRTWKKKTLKDDWREGDTVNFSIGQGAVTSTPVQAALMMAAVANGGDIFKPYLLDRAMDANGSIVFQQGPAVRRHVDLSPGVWKSLRAALEGVVKNGSGRVAYRPDLISGAKTGTAQNPHGDDHAWFSIYSGKPGEGPSLVVVVFVENGGFGSAAAGPVARDVINTVFPLAGKPL